MSAKLSAKEKENKLLEVAKQEGSAISPWIRQKHLARLVDGDLSHIGDGILEGKDALMYNEVYSWLNFDAEAWAYSLAPAQPTSTAHPLSYYLQASVASHVEKISEMVYFAFASETWLDADGDALIDKILISVDGGASYTESAELFEYLSDELLERVFNTLTKELTSLHSKADDQLYDNQD